MKFLRLGGAVFAGLILSVVFATSAHAYTFTVDSTGDEPAVDPGNADPSIACDTALDTCTLRSAIEAANAQAGADTIEFNISGAGVHTFTPASAYPGITEQLTIDGTTQAGASTCTNNALVPASLPASNSPYTLLIEIDGTNAITGYNQGIIDFTNTSASSSTVRGLVINRASSFNGAAIYIGTDSITNITIECNYLGTNTAGAAASANVSGVSITASDIDNLTIQNNLISGNVATNIYIYGNSSTAGLTLQNNLVGTNVSGIAGIGGSGVSVSNVESATVNRNVFSGNTSPGFQYNSSYFLTFQGNYVGLNIAGSSLGNTGGGVVLYASNNMTFGGTSANSRNIISANGGDGIHIYNDCSGNTGQASNSTIFNNYIGTNSSGAVQSGFGNNGAGIEVNEYYGGCVSVYKHQIGGDNAGEANIIAGNTGQGLLIHQASSSDVFSITNLVNSMYGNGQFGIDLASDSDINSGTADVDLGPNPINNNPITYPTNGFANNYLNYPTLNSVSSAGNQLTVNYNFQANPVANSFPQLLPSNLVGYRLDFYLNDAGQDGAYAGHSQGKHHIGSFIVDGSETNATHVFTSPVTPTNGQVVTATATVLWQNIGVCDGTQQGDGPPYSYCGPT